MSYLINNWISFNKDVPQSVFNNLLLHILRRVEETGTILEGQLNLDSLKSMCEQNQVTIDFNTLIPMPDFLYNEDFNEQRIWRIRTWGSDRIVKDTHIYLEDREIFFQTAWSEPTPVFFALHEQFPDVGFEWNYSTDKGEAGCVLASNEGIRLYIPALGTPDAHKIFEKCWGNYLSKVKSRGVILRVVEPQPVARLICTLEENSFRKWKYPSKDLWKAWNDPDYKLPKGIKSRELEKIWESPYDIEDTVAVQEPWAFRECSECCACESPRVRYCGKPGCFVYPTPFNQADTAFQPAHLMPKEAARTHLISLVQMMPLQMVPVDQYYENGFVCPDGQLFPSNFRSVWDNSLPALTNPAYKWDANPFVWVATFERG